MRGRQARVQKAKWSKGIISASMDNQYWKSWPFTIFFNCFVWISHLQKKIQTFTTTASYIINHQEENSVDHEWKTGCGAGNQSHSVWKRLRTQVQAPYTGPHRSKGRAPTIWATLVKGDLAGGHTMCLRCCGTNIDRWWPSMNIQAKLIYRKDRGVAGKINLHQFRWIIMRRPW